MITHDFIRELTSGTLGDENSLYRKLALQVSDDYQNVSIRLKDQTKRINKQAGDYLDAVSKGYPNATHLLPGHQDVIDLQQLAARLDQLLEYMRFINKMYENEYIKKD